MKYGDMQSVQQGFALVLSLLILLTMIIIGVAAMNSTIMQERMAGNASTQADVFETSSEGVTRALELFYDNAGAFTFGPDELSCGQVFGTTIATQNALAWDFPDAGAWHLASETGDNPKLEQRMYCCRSWEEFDDGSGGTVWVEQTSKLFGLSRATFMGGANNAQSLALREIEVEMAEAEPDDSTCAICVPGNMGTVTGPNSGSLNVSGNCGAAVLTDRATDPNSAADFIAGIGSAAIGNFDGGVIAGEMISPWNTPARLAEFVFWVKLGLEAGSSAGDAALGDSNVRGLYIDLDDDNSDLALEPTYSDTGNSAYGTVANPQITYIDGDAEFGGNISGAGIIISRGSLTWSGTPDYNGLLISLGGGFIVGGGGRGGNPSGSMVITDLDYIGVGSDDGLYGPEVLEYEVARADSAQHVKMYHPPGQACNAALDVCGGDLNGDITSYSVPARPILVGDAIGDPELIVYYDEDAGQHHCFLAAPNNDVTHEPGAKLNCSIDLGSGDFSIEIIYVEPIVDSNGNPIPTILKRPPDSNGDLVPDFTRDAYGRLIPDFVRVDNYPDDYGYNPNLWNWDADTADAQFEWGTSDFTWGGGGNQNFTYDCRTLQRVKHQLLCAQPIQNLPTDPNNDFFKDPEAYYGDYCWHSVAGVEGGTGGGTDGKYFEDYIASPTIAVPTLDRPENQKAWHMWSPSCDCLGISVEAEMIVTGWRENLGWRDDEAFQGCSGLPSPSGI